jgi:hypothetical protein
VTTLAGDGTAGFRDGRAAQAQFIFPTALAYDARTGDLYIADSGAQRIRMLSPDGIVSTIGGSGPLQLSGLSVAGGYADGPAGQARFNHPTGLAIGHDGAIYVADSQNHCIRVIRDGAITTFAGGPQRSGSHDGPLAEATFSSPRGIAVTENGTIYVADYTVGVRVISANGIVSTLPGPDYLKETTNVAVWAKSGGMLYALSRWGVAHFDLSGPVPGKAFDPIDSGREPFGLAALNINEYVTSIPRSHAIFYQGEIRRRVAGNLANDLNGGDGYVDGSPGDARFFEPMGIALNSAGNIFVADAGNRRIRLVPKIDLRSYQTAPVGSDAGVYRIAFISNSFAYHFSMWPDSIEGTLEQRLNADRSRIGLPRRVSVQAIPYGNSLESHAEYIENILAQGSADLVIWSVNSNLFRYDFEHWMFVAPVFSTDNDRKWRGVIFKARGALETAGIPLVVADQPFGIELSPTETTDLREVYSLRAEGAHLGWLRDPTYGYDINTEMEDFLASLRLQYYVPTFGQFVTRERNGHEPLSSDVDPHYNGIGNAFYGNLLADYLEKHRPWETRAAGPGR